MSDDTTPAQPAASGDRPPTPPQGPPPLPPTPPQSPYQQAPTQPAAGGIGGYVTPPAPSATQFRTGFFRALFDFSFRTFITRRLAGIFYIIGIAVIAILFLVYFIGGLVTAVATMRYSAGPGFLLLLGTVVIVPIVTFLGVIVLRFWIEAVVALIAVAENTGRTAENTQR